MTMPFREKAHWLMLVREHDTRESRNFLVGLGNGIWISALLTFGLYWFLQFLL
jgi:hypothetical protein